MSSEVWDEITHLFPNFNCFTVDKLILMEYQRIVPCLQGHGIMN